MRFATVEYDHKLTIGIIENDLFFDLHQASNGLIPDTMIEAIKLDDSFAREANRLYENGKKNLDDKLWFKLSDVKLKAPIPRPLKNIFCVGKNYADHIAELGNAQDIPKAPIFFTKTPTTVIGSEEMIQSHHQVTDKLDYEGELAVVIGKKGKSIARDEAFEYIFGYTIINDVTARDLQKRHQQFFLGKSLDTFCPMGPVIVHKSQINDPRSLSIITKVNGEIRQSASTKQLIFDIPELIAVLAQGMTLEPGDIIATGTPSGVGLGFHPPKFLQAGDVIEITVEGIGTLKNTVSHE